jgi:hypothetical protein
MALRLPRGQVIDVFVSPHGNVKAARRGVQNLRRLTVAFDELALVI